MQMQNNHDLHNMLLKPRKLKKSIEKLLELYHFIRS